jgi:thioredoxin-related protein
MVVILVTLSPSVPWLTDFGTAKEAAQREHKYILLNFSGSDWCAPCIKLKREVFENESFLAMAEEKLILLRADFPRSKKNQLSKVQTEHNEVLAEKYNPSGKFPLTLILDANGKIIKEWDGYVFASQEKFIAALDKLLSSI